MKKIFYRIKNILFNSVEIPLDIILLPIAIIFSLFRRVNRLSIKINRNLNDLRLKGRVRK